MPERRRAIFFRSVTCRPPGRHPSAQDQTEAPVASETPRIEPSIERLNPLGERFLPYLWAIAAVSIGVVLRTLLNPLLGTELPFITLFPAIFVAAYFGGFGPASLATVLSTLAAINLFFTGQFGALSHDTVAQLGVALFAVTGLSVGWLGEARVRAHRHARIAVRAAETEAARAEEETVRAEEEAARAEEEMLRAEEEMARAEREAGNAARESARVESILSSITDSFLALNHDWVITYINERTAALLGRHVHEIVGHKLWAMFPEILGGPIEQAYRHAAASRTVTRAEVYSPVSKRWVGMTLYPSPEGLTVVGQDISDRIRAHEAMTQLAAIVSSSDAAIVGKTLDGTVTTWNAAAEQIFGYEAGEIVGQTIFTIIPPDAHEIEHDLLQRIARGESVEMVEVDRLRRDGRRVTVAVTMSPIRDPAGRVVGLSSIKRDVTERKRMEAALAAESARSRDLAQALDASQAMVRTLDGVISYWSTGSTRLYGWTAAEAVGQVVHELLQAELPVPMAEIRAALLAHEQWDGEIVYVAKDTRRVHVAVQWILRRGDHGEPRSIIEIATDVTARRQAEEQIRQSERMEVVGQLAGGVAHEANNQMTVVLGATDFLLRRTDLAAEAREDVEQVRAAAERTAAITAQLLAFSRRQVLQPQVFDLDEAVQGLDSMLRRAVGERSTLVLDLRATRGRVRADPGQIAQVLLNLALNARDAMPLGGQLTIETSVTRLTETHVLRHPGAGIEPGDYMVLAVSDTGHGMSPDTMRHIFEPFYTTKAIGKGTGLGLATVYGIVKQSGGYVWAYSEIGKGSTFKVYLPLERNAVPVAPAETATARGNGELVLLVEDEPVVRQMAARALQEHGYGVVAASGGTEALSTVERLDGTIHLVVTDVVMPGMDGPELARHLARLKPGIPVLFMSGYTDDDVVRRGLLEAGEPFLQKPFDPETLVERVAELVKAKNG